MAGSGCRSRCGYCRLCSTCITNSAALNYMNFQKFKLSRLPSEAVKKDTAGRLITGVNISSLSSLYSEQVLSGESERAGRRTGKRRTGDSDFRSRSRVWPSASADWLNSAPFSSTTNLYQDHPSEIFELIKKLVRSSGKLCLPFIAWCQNVYFADNQSRTMCWREKRSYWACRWLLGKSHITSQEKLMFNG